MSKFIVKRDYESNYIEVKCVDEGYKNPKFKDNTIFYASHSENTEKYNNHNWSEMSDNDIIKLLDNEGLIEDLGLEYEGFHPNLRANSPLYVDKIDYKTDFDDNRNYLMNLNLIDLKTPYCNAMLNFTSGNRSNMEAENDFAYCGFKLSEMFDEFKKDKPNSSMREFMNYYDNIFKREPFKLVSEQRKNQWLADFKDSIVSHIDSLEYNDLRKMHIECEKSLSHLKLGVEAKDLIVERIIELEYLSKSLEFHKSNITSDQYGLLNDFANILYYYNANQDNGGFDANHWAKTLDDANISWYLQNTVSGFTHDYTNKGYYLSTLLAEKDIHINTLENRGDFVKNKIFNINPLEKGLERAFDDKPLSIRDIDLALYNDEHIIIRDTLNKTIIDIEKNYDGELMYKFFDENIKYSSDNDKITEPDNYFKRGVIEVIEDNEKEEFNLPNDAIETILKESSFVAFERKNSPTVDECLAKVEEQEAAKSSVKTPSL